MSIANCPKCRRMCLAESAECPNCGRELNAASMRAGARETNRTFMRRATSVFAATLLILLAALLIAFIERRRDAEATRASPPVTHEAMRGR